MSEQLLDWNRRGLIQGPDESDEAFFRRCRLAKKTEVVISSSLAEEIFDIEPDWIPVAFDNKQLNFWEGACAWIEEERIALQLRKNFQKKKAYLGLYTQEEVIAHEYVHAARHAFEEPIFEEMLAYQTSSSFFRRFLGPLFRTSSETNYFLFSFALLFTALFTPYQLIALIGIPILFGGGLIRLLRTRRMFEATRERLTNLVGKQKALAVMLRLSDREIIRFSKMDGEEILTYAFKMSRTRIRWKQIVHAYFSSHLITVKTLEKLPFAQCQVV